MEEGYFYRDTWAEVDLDSISQNIQSVRNILPKNVEMIAVVKANAYGHGDAQVSRAALEAGATCLAVAFLDEAVALRNHGIVAPILVLGATRAKDVQIAVKHNITVTVFQLNWLKEAKTYLKSDEKLLVHIKIDTGMGRIGVRNKEELLSLERFLNAEQNFSLEGIFTHFATADELDSTYFEQQLEMFNDMLNVLSRKPKYIHCSNSATAIRFPKAYFNAVRLGIVMYGLTPSLQMESEIPFKLKEAFTLYTRLAHVKMLEKGDKVSYGSTYEAKGDEWIGTIPIGYADGWIRKLQGIEVLVEGKPAPIVGRICMDQCMIKLPQEFPIGTKITLIGHDGSKFISINDIAEKLDTINYEIPCILSKRIPRLYKKQGEMVEIKNYLL